MKFQTRFDVIVYDGTFNDKPSMTQQHFKDDCDINVLYKRFVKANGIDPLAVGPHYEIDLKAPVYDVSDVNGLQGMFDKADEATEVFMQLPPEVREKFENNPARLRDAIESYKEPKDLEKYGIFMKGVQNATQIGPAQVQENVSPDSTPNPQA